MTNAVETMYLIHRENVRHSLGVLRKMAENARDKGEHPTIQAAGKVAAEAVDKADKELRAADRSFRDLGLEMKGN